MVLTVDLITEQTGEAIAQWIGPIAEAVGAELAVTDDAENFRTAVTQRALPHQVCKAHVKRNTEVLVQELLLLVQTDTDGSLARCEVLQSKRKKI